MEQASKDKKTIGSVIKAFDIVDLLASTDSELGVTEISSALNYGVSATYHLLATLQMLRVIEQDRKTKKYRLGLKMWKIGEKAKEQNQLVTYLRPYLKQIRDFTGETTNLTVLDQNEIIYIAQEESPKLIRMFTTIGARVPLYCSAAGKVLLAYQPPQQRDAILARLRFQHFTERTIANVPELISDLERIRAQGYGLDEEEREAGVSCYAAPVFGFDGVPIAAISISGPTTRLNKTVMDKYIAYLLSVTREIAKDLSPISITLG